MVRTRRWAVVVWGFVAGDAGVVVCAEVVQLLIPIVPIESSDQILFVIKDVDNLQLSWFIFITFFFFFFIAVFVIVT